MTHKDTEDGKRSRGHREKDTHSGASSTSRARGTGFTTNTLGTFRASGSLGTSFTLRQRQDMVNMQQGTHLPHGQVAVRAEG